MLAGSALRCEGFQDQRLHSQNLRASFRLGSSRRPAMARIVAGREMDRFHL
jgi:hypothetical protein